MIHTKGKWLADGRNIISKHNGIELFIGDMLTGHQIPNEEAQANAKHIVQIHNSHEGLLEIVVNLKDLIERPENALYRTEHWIKRAKKAIAQVEE